MYGSHDGHAESGLLFRGQAARVELGAELTNNIGFTAGTMWLES
jgi:hypothetical protein